ncbi:MAG: hypothetical protein MR388_00415 [Tenericutes bacterium]|nr:hypothetical protein [Mycoplasmatota bacterium]
MKKLIISILLLLTIGFIFTNYSSLMRFAMEKIVYKDEQLVKDNNIYYKENNWSYVQLTDNFYPKKEQDILNLFYTALDGGWSELTYYCTEEFPDCIKYTEKIVKDNYILSNINNFVATYNSYNKIYVNYNTLGRVYVTFEKIYSKKQIELIDQKIDEIISEIITDNMSDREKIKAVHDYIINHTRYDEEHANAIKNGLNEDTPSASNTAYGVLFNGKAICSGYTDAMALFLDKLGFKNYKIFSPKHTWNCVFVDGSWRHLDLTWDDPVTSNGEDRLEYNFFLITDDELEEKNTGQHNYDRTIYVELNEKKA